MKNIVNINKPDLTDYPYLNFFFNKRKVYYILDKNKNVIPASLLEWGTFLEEKRKERIVKKDIIDGFIISTVFLGLNHNLDPFDDKLHIFETMIFKDGNEDVYCERYETWKEAEEGHMKALQWVKDGCKDNE